MYRVIVDGNSVGTSDTAVYIKKGANGCYIPCGMLEAEGVCVKIPYEQETSDGDTITTVRDVVFSIKGKTLDGATQTASIEKFNGAI